MYKNVFLLTLIIFGLSNIASGQDTISNKNLVVKRGNKTFDLKRYADIKIIQNVVRNQKDSLRLVIDGDSIIRNGDTLLVRPWVVNEDRFVYDDKPTSKRTYFNGPTPTSTLLKIPINEVEKITSKKQPYCFIMSSVVALSIIGTFAGLAIPPDSDRQIELRTKIAIPFYAAWVVSLTARLAWGEKNMRFDKKRTRKKTWTFQ